MPRQDGARTVVIDASVFTDYHVLYPKRPERHRRARRVLDEFSHLNFTVYEPFLFEIELKAVLVRRLEPKLVLEIAETILSHVNIVNEDEIHNVAAEIALMTGCRAVDSYYIATAKKFKAMLVTSDKIMRDNAIKMKIDAYYLLDDRDYKALLRFL